MSSESQPEVSGAPTKPERKKSKLPQEITLYSYAKIFFLWPVVVAGVISFLVNLVFPGIPQWIHGCFWLLAMTVSTLTLGEDIPRNVAVIIGLVVVVLVMGLVILSLLNVSLGWLGTFFVSLKPDTMPKVFFDYALVVALIASFSFFVGRLDRQWRISSNQWEHISYQRVDRTIAHGSKSVRAEYPDVFEKWLLGAGDIVISDPTGKIEIERITGIPNLAKRWDILEDFLEEIRVRNIRPGLEEGASEEG